ncbi:MAG: hypothetical protein ONB44_14065 [candidate division KSB1 bacterium]|nr:hypothetical protein [candidate division KSB1 bacterium]MDZ7303250.1 hypothetical protein [candidate division KSB1 bacterium]MDZ7312138.1 hypothetical protein [candidate division KSB1 bacterium]
MDKYDGKAVSGLSGFKEEKKVWDTEKDSHRKGKCHAESIFFVPSNSLSFEKDSYGMTSKRSALAFPLVGQSSIIQ